MILYYDPCITAAFDHGLLVAVKAGEARRPYEPKLRLPCTYGMIQHIVYPTWFTRRFVRRSPTAPKTSD